MPASIFKGRPHHRLLDGIGRATALRLAGAGWTVYATARRPESIADLEQAGCKTLALDVTDEDSMDAAVKAVEEAEGAVGVLVNNAGYSQGGPIEQVPMEAVRRQFETNVFGAIRLTQLVLPEDARRSAGARSSTSVRWAAVLTFPGGGLYHATKYSLEAISDALRFEVRGFGVDAILIEPGLITSDFAQAAVASTATLDDAARTADGAYSSSTRRSPRSRPASTRARCAASAAAGRRGEGDREGDLAPPRTRARARDALGTAHGAPATPAPGPRVGRGDASAVPAAPLARKGSAIRPPPRAGARAAHARRGRAAMTMAHPTSGSSQRR